MSPPFAVTFDAFANIEFWTSVGVLAGIYAIVALGLQLNVGFTGILNFGQAGFMAIGAYAMAILVADHDMSFWLALPIAVLATVAFALLVGLSSLRLRADYFAIVTIAAAEAVRLVASNARDLTGGAQGIGGFSADWDALSRSIEDFIVSLGWTDVPGLFPLFLVTWALVIVLTIGLTQLQKTPWGRVLRAVREDEDAARALGKNAFAYKLQSLALSATIGAIAGFLVALNLKFVVPDAFQPTLTFLGFAILVLGGLANYYGAAVGAVLLFTVLEGLRFVELPITETQVAALRFIVLGLLLIGLMAFRPQGLFGNKREMMIGD
ncbi:branched-chain amino acid ABC transporter permease [Conexibacter woesei]|uniref:Inner-membrane translocator n=1 Tax=Conexibacter woesei (strain DSM 14684 / CCUG 47730 / CIP 108061 / JCM 11494 / NBRC 100937 / ID131577) TaxID=469383 RepID=D3F3L9_CONWI|nr:branched-chain amino acid ABC transporter permease [Conexibacter woesei]ADB52384.1 inner-membrane translocator [Conexibacter woesei DSM 14684]